MENRILITGGSGFIGTNLINHLISLGYTNIQNIDNKRPKCEEHLPYWNNCDLIDAAVLHTIISAFNPNWVFHLAARTDLDGKNLEAYTANHIGTKNLINSINFCTNVKNVVFTSSMLVCRIGYLPKDELDFAPNTYYGESKVLMEKNIRKSGLNCPWLIVRPTSIWGPFFESPYKDFFERVIKKKMYNIQGYTPMRTYGFVYNSVSQISSLLFADTTQTNRKVFYIGDTPSLNVTEWGNAISEELGYKKIPEFNYSVFKCAAIIGDMLAYAGIKFPITSFRLNNLVSDYVLPLDNTLNISGKPKYQLKEAIQITLKYLNNN